jgi:putative SOS response-associated peptidase YedK
MCNLYSITTNQEAIRALFRVVNQYVGNLPPMSGVFPDYPAPVIRNAGTEREMILMRWGMPPPPRTGGPPVTNIRNTASPHWRGWLKPESRCLVPFNSFAEYAPEPNPETKKRDVVWFAQNEDRPLCAFAGIWTEHKAIAAPSRNRFRVRIWSMVSSPRSPTRWSSLFIPSRCR